MVARTALAGDWEQIDLGYQVVPGYQAEQTDPDFQVSVNLTLSADGSFNGNGSYKWTYATPWLTLNWGGARTDQLLVQPGRDWENEKGTLIFTGLNNRGVAVWGKKK